MKALFLTALEISLSTSLVILGLLLFSQVLNKRYFAKWKYFIWIALALRLAVPVKLELPKLPQLPQQEIVFEMPARMAAPIVRDTIVPAPQQAQPVPSLTPLDVIAAIWLIGCAVFLLVHLSAYLRYRRRVMVFGERTRDVNMLRLIRSLSKELGVSASVPVRTYSGASSPMVLGALRPILVLPDMEYRPEELRFILRHELIHLKRHDLLFKFLFVVANAVHWFNPVVYLMQKEAVVDMELSCDETVVENTGFENRKAYTETLLATLCRQQMKSTNLSTQFYGGKQVMKKRFQNIFNRAKKKNGLLILVIAVSAALILGTVIGFTVGETAAAYREAAQSEAGEMALNFTAACIRDDTDSMEACLEKNFSGTLETYGSWNLKIDSGRDLSVVSQTESEVTFSIPMEGGNHNMIVRLHLNEDVWKVRDYYLEYSTGESKPIDEKEQREQERLERALDLAADNAELRKVQEAAARFARAYFGGDLETAQSCRAYPDTDFGVYNGPSFDYEKAIAEGLHFSPDIIAYSLDNVDQVDKDISSLYSMVTVLLDLQNTDAPEDADYFIMELSNQEEGWRIRSFGFGKVATEEDCRQIGEITEAFAEAYFDGNAAALKAYMSSVPSEYSERGAYSGQILDINAIKGIPQAASSLIIDGQVVTSVEFHEAESPDSFTYLTLEFIKQGPEWKVDFYGLEK